MTTVVQKCYKEPFFRRQVRNIKFTIKLFYKAIVNNKILSPHQVISFDEILSNSYTANGFIYYNRFERNNYKITLENEHLLPLPSSKILKGDLSLEGENDLSFKTNRKHLAVTPKVKCYSIQNAGVIGREGYVYDVARHRFIKETIRVWFKWDQSTFNSYRSSLEKFRPVYLDGVTLLIARPGAGGYYHFLHESLPIYLLFKQKYPSIKFDNIIVGESENFFKKEWLASAGISTERVVFAEFNSHFVCEQLIFTSDLCFQYSPNLLTTNLLKNLQQGEVQLRKKDRKILIASRRDSTTRNLEWEDELAAAFNAKIVLFSNLKAAEVIEECQKCTVFVGAHGAAFSNIVFCTPGTTVIEIAFGTDEVLYSRLSAIMGLDHVIFDISAKKEIFNYLATSV